MSNPRWLNSRLLLPAPATVEVSPRLLLKQALERTPEQNGAFPCARAVYHGKPGAKLIYFPSRKQGGSLICFGPLIQARCLLLEGDDQTNAYRTFPQVLPIAGGRYTPSIVREDTNHNLHVEELRYEGELTAQVSLDAQEIESSLGSEEITFSLLTEKSIYQEPILHNLDFLYRGQYSSMPPEGRALVYDFISATGGQASLTSIYRLLNQNCIRSVCVLDMMWHGLLRYDTASKLHYKSKVWVPDGQA